MPTEPRKPPPLRSLTVRDGSARSSACSRSAVFMSSLDLFIVNLAFPYIGARVRRHQPGRALVGAQRLHDRVRGRRWCPPVAGPTGSGAARCLSPGSSSSAPGRCSAALAPGVAALIAARVIQAVGAGMMVPTSLSLLLAEVPAEGRARAIGTWSAVGALGAGARPGDRRPARADQLAAGVLDQPAGRLSRACARPAVVHREPRRKGAGPARPRRCRAARGQRRAGRPRRSSRRRTGAGDRPVRRRLLAASLACGAAMVARSRSAPLAGDRARALCARVASAARSLASILYYAGFGAFVLSSVEFLTTVWGYSAVRAGLAIAPGPLMVLPFARLVAPASRSGSAARDGSPFSAAPSAARRSCCGSHR